MARPKRVFRVNEIKVIIKDRHPCDHPGCLNHLSHPCEGCGRIGGKGDITENWLR